MQSSGQFDSAEVPAEPGAVLPCVFQRSSCNVFFPGLFGVIFCFCIFGVFFAGDVRVHSGSQVQC